MIIKNRMSCCPTANRRAAGRTRYHGGRPGCTDPYENTKKIVRLESGKLIIGNPEFSEPVGREPVGFNLDEVKNIYIVGGGKSVQKIALALEEVLGDRITEGRINAKKGDEIICHRVNVTLAGHPMPDEDSVAGAARMLEIEKRAGKGDVVFWVTSGGGSALKALPAPGISLQDLQAVYRILYFGCGASHAGSQRRQEPVDHRPYEACQVRERGRARQARSD
jgi:glycerate-2-kinase